MRFVCVIDTVAIELRFVSKQDVTMQATIAIEPLAKVKSLRHSWVRDVLAARDMDTRPLHAVFSIT
jgi:hypothetical protein